MILEKDLSNSTKYEVLFFIINKMQIIYRKNLSLYYKKNEKNVQKIETLSLI